ncbi:DNA-formamidopyrimidine glycosylase [Paenibacillus psychroresistens]|uniref:Formamidopyrimidine-DNA glycosylase n=1 Tax=Paenibacillus psychroresistens TaxID=1778678 RepID=A0A6B8RQL0_9BACL|nr:DNA-formamidopyrimidine glycosylase [Paenibacillus psychroresistens]QGQ97578.1 DNA-formamidopyrimidine glycosylase [Paenibacillus psychroresistens]
MPELPEVETVVRTLNQLVGGKRIQRVEVLLNRIIQRPVEPEQFTAALENQLIHRIERRGKFIRFILDEIVMVSHLRMEGRYGLHQEDEPIEKHTHVVFYFTDGTQLRYKDVRQFGTMHLFATGDELIMKPLHKLGLEPLDESFTYEVFHARIAHRSTKIKPLLLNQEFIVGLGNIYVDESLYRAGIFSERETNKLTELELRKLHTAIVVTLQAAVEAGGSSIKSYVNGQGEMGMFQQQLQVYGRKGEPCEECGSLIEKIVVGGRGTHYCPQCQPKEPS